MIKRGMESRKKTESAVIQPANGIIKRLEFCGNARNQKLTKQKNHAIIKKLFDRRFLLQQRRERSMMEQLDYDVELTCLKRKTSFSG